MDISEYTVNADWTPVSMYEIREQIPSTTETYSRDEILQARNVVVAELTKEKLERYKPDLILVDKKNRTGKTMVIHAMIQNEKDQFDGTDSNNRTFYINDGKIIKIEKGKPRQVQ